MKTTKDTMKNGNLFQIIRTKFWYLVVFDKKTDALLDLIKDQDDIDKVYLYAKELNEPKYEFLIKKREDGGIKYCNDPNSFIECLNRMNDVYQNIDDYNPSRKRKILLCLMTWSQTLWITKNFKSWLNNYLLGAEKWIFHLFLSFSLIFLFQKMWD